MLGSRVAFWAEFAAPSGSTYRLVEGVVIYDGARGLPDECAANGSSWFSEDERTKFLQASQERILFYDAADGIIVRSSAHPTVSVAPMQARYYAPRRTSVEPLQP